MPCCPAVIDLWAEEENVVFPEVPENGRNLRTMIREKMMEMFRNKEQSIEETLLESFIFCWNYIRQSRKIRCQKKESRTISPEKP